MHSLLNHISDAEIRMIADKVSSGVRISGEEGLILYKKTDLSLLGVLAGLVRRRHNSTNAYYNHNFHIEPTNKCIYNCKFCSYHKNEGDPESWEYSHD